MTLEIQPTELQSLLSNNEDEASPVTLIDCRELEERDLVCITPSIHLPMSQLPGGIEALEGKQAAPLVVYCHHGVRSQNVANWLGQQGFANVRSLAGGIDAWAEEIEPEMQRY